ncbi:DUF6566 family protein [Trinickia sp. YCB016]
MEAKGVDMGDYQEAYKGYDLEVCVEQVMTGVKSHFRVLKGDEVVVAWRLVHIDGYWPTEHKAAVAALEAAREAVDRELQS